MDQDKIKIRKFASGRECTKTAENIVGNLKESLKDLEAVHGSVEDLTKEVSYFRDGVKIVKNRRSSKKKSKEKIQKKSRRKNRRR